MPKHLIIYTFNNPEKGKQPDTSVGWFIFNSTLNTIVLKIKIS